MNPDAVSYIKDELTRGVSKDAIKNALIQAGWDKVLVENSFAYLDTHANITERVSKLIGEEKRRLGISQSVSVGQKPAQTSLALPASPTVRELPAIVSHFAGGDVNHEHQKKLADESDHVFGAQLDSLLPKNVLSGVTTTTEGIAQNAGGATNVPPKSRRLNKRLVEALIGGLIVAGVASGGYFGWQYYQDRVLPTRVLAAMPESMAGLTSLRYKAKIYFKTSPEKSTLSQDAENNRVPSFAHKLNSGIGAADLSRGVADILGLGEQPTAYLPSAADTPSILPQELQDADVEVRIGGVYQQAGDHTNFSTELSFNVEQGKQNIGMGGEFRMIDDMYYARLTQLPLELVSPALALPPFGTLDVTRVLRNWYSLKTSTLADSKLIPGAADRNAEREQALQNKLKELYAKSALFDIVSSEKGGTGADMVYHYVLAPKPEEMVAFMNELIKLGEDRGLTRGEELNIQNLVEEFKKSTIEMWIRADGAYLTKVFVSIPDFSYGALAFKTDVTFEFEDFNTAELQKPASAISLDDQFKGMIAGSFGIGTAGMLSRDAQRIAEAKQTQLVLELYFDQHGSYPSNLKLLVPEFTDHAPVDTESNVPYSYTPHVANGMNTGYHLGVSLEDESSGALQNDADCNSKTGTHCGTFKNDFVRSGAFDGSDAKGCRGERERYCYDITP